VSLRGWRSAPLMAMVGLTAALAAPPVGPPPSPEQLFSRGNDLYSRGDYAAASEAYRQIAAAGIRNGRVYYNLGNTCFRQNRIGEAILYYEKALKLDPTDPDARENLRFANQRIRDRIPAEDLPLLLALLERAEHLLRLEQVTSLFLGLYLLCMALALIWILGHGRRWASGAGVAAAGALVLAIGAGGWMIAQGRERSASSDAIVLQEKVDVLSGPGSENTLLASIHEGTKVRIHNRREEWVQVTLPDGRAGWMRGESLGEI